MSCQDNVDNIKRNGYNFELGKYISEGWSYFKDNAGLMIVFTILYSVISIVINFIPFLSIILSVIISTPLAVGVAYACHLADKGHSPELGHFFKGFDHIGTLIVNQLLLFVIYLVLLLPLIAVLGFSLIPLLLEGGLENSILQMFTAGNTFIIVLTVFLMICASVFLRYAPYFIIFCGQNATTAIKNSFAVTIKNPLMHILLLIVYMFIFLGGLLCLFIGLLAALPFVQAADYASFKNIVGYNQLESHKIDQIGVEEDLV